MSRRRPLRHRLRRDRGENASVDVTAFLSLMVILIPFLLISAVFSGITILELRTPANDDDQAALADPLQLQLVVRAARIEVGFQGRRSPVVVERSDDGNDWTELASLMTDLKRRFPDSQEATILLEPQIPYDVLVRVMDTVRLQPQLPGSEVPPQPLFPGLVLGEVVSAITGVQRK